MLSFVVLRGDGGVSCRTSFSGSARCRRDGSANLQEEKGRKRGLRGLREERAEGGRDLYTGASVLPHSFVSFLLIFLFA